MPLLKKLPAGLKAQVFALAELRSTLSQLEDGLRRAHEAVAACKAVPRKELAAITPQLDAAHAHLSGLVATRAQACLDAAGSHFGKQGLAEGCVVRLAYPLYGRRLDGAFDDARVPRRLAQATLKVQGFSAEHVRSRTEVVLGLRGRVVEGNRLGAELVSLPLHPGCEFELLKPAPARAAPPGDAAAGQAPQAPPEPA